MIKKAIIAAGGFGTRFLPVTKTVPKELLNIINVPAIEYITEECVKAGIRDIIVVTRKGNESLENYLDSSYELEKTLEKSGKTDYLNQVRYANKKANFYFIRQSSELPYGTATPLLLAKNLISNGESFAYIFGDDIFWGEKNALKEMIDSYKSALEDGLETNINGILGAYKIPKKDAYKYGIFKTKKYEGYELIEEVVEKPSVDEFEDDFVSARVGRFIYHSSIFNYFDTRLIESNPRGEFELTDVENKFIAEGNNLLIQNISDEWLPIGDPASYLRTTLKIALKDEKYRDIVIDEINKYNSY